jgi:predicted HAD superfamily Cof-like phosphohydrolase
MSNLSEKTLEFTLAAGQYVPNKPETMNKEEVYFLTKMIIDELLEFCATIDNSDSVKFNMIKMIFEAKEIDQLFDDPNKDWTTNDIIAEQADALVDIMYYSGNAAAKKGVNLNSVLDVVHQANMKKKDPESGMFLKRSDGKIIKPEGWDSPNISDEIQRQHEQGSFSFSFSSKDTTDIV